MGKLKRNVIKCKLCNDVIESEYRHDFKWCRCGSCAIDGGLAYQRILGDLENIDMTLTEYYKEGEKPKEKITSEKYDEEYDRLMKLMLLEVVNNHGKTRNKD